MTQYIVKMLDCVIQEEFKLVILADSAEHARVIANTDWPDSLFISAKEAE